MAVRCGDNAGYQPVGTDALAILGAAPALRRRQARKAIYHPTGGLSPRPMEFLGRRVHPRCDRYTKFYKKDMRASTCIGSACLERFPSRRGSNG